MVEEVLSNIFTNKGGVLDGSLLKLVPAEEMVVTQTRVAEAPLPLDVRINGHGLDGVSDSAFDTALESSIGAARLFRLVSDDGPDTLYVVLLSIVPEVVRLTPVGPHIHRNAIVKSSWHLTEGATGDVVVSSTIVTECPEDEIGTFDTLRTMTGCAVRRAIAEGIEEMSALKLH